MTKDPRVYLAHILESIDRIERFTSGDRASFVADPMVQDAVIRNLEVIGEAAKRVDEDYQAAHPEVPWRALAGLRDILIHRYEGVDLGRVWTVVEQDIPPLRTAIASLLPPMDALEREIAGDADRPDRTTGP